MLRAAILARKSTDDDNKNEDSKSVTRQVAHAREYIAAKGWRLDESHIYVDDGISGAEFKNRPGLLRLMNHLKEFDAVVMSELSRLGREQSNTSAVLAQINAAGVRVFFYLTDEELRYDSAIEKFMVSAAAFAAELEREKASQRARDAALKRAKEGKNFGGRVYGYDNVPVYGAAVNGQEVRTHTDYRVNESEAGIVRGIFRACADGRGLTAIAKALNGDPACGDLADRYFGGACPPPPRKGTGSWAPSSIREMLHRPRYTGKVPFGEHRKVLRGRSTARVRQAEYLLVDRPDLRIVPDELWRAVQTRLHGLHEQYKRFHVRRVESKYLLSGLLRCEHCGGPMVGTSVSIGPPGKRRRVPRYGCSYALSRGATVCTNTLKPHIDVLDGQVLDAIERTALTPATIRRVLELVLATAKAEQRSGPGRARSLDTEERKLQQEMDRLIALVVSGRPPARVLEEIASREKRLAELRRETALRNTAADKLDLRRIEAMALERLNSLRAILHGNPAEGRHALRQILAEPIMLRSLGGGCYTFRGATHLGPLLAADNTHGGASPDGSAAHGCLVVRFAGPLDLAA